MWIELKFCDNKKVRLVNTNTIKTIEGYNDSTSYLRFVDGTVGERVEYSYEDLAMMLVDNAK